MAEELKINDLIEALNAKGHNFELADNGFQAVRAKNNTYTVLTVIDEDDREAVEVETTTGRTRLKNFWTDEPDYLEKLHQYLLGDA